MADILTRVPESIEPLIEEIKEVKAERSEPTSRKAIVTEAIKTLHKKVCK